VALIRPLRSSPITKVLKPVSVIFQAEPERLPCPLVARKGEESAFVRVIGGVERVADVGGFEFVHDHAPNIRGHCPAVKSANAAAPVSRPFLLTDPGRKPY